MEGCNYADAMEVQRGADAITTRGLVILVWWFMPLRGKVPRDSWWWCGFVRIKWGALAAVRCRDSGFNSDLLATAGVGPRGKVYQLTGKLSCP
jgi:hypothetical protein